MTTKTKLRTIHGDYAYTTAEDAADVVEVSGTIYAPAAKSLSLPKLTSSGTIDAPAAKSLSLPKLEQCSGTIYAPAAKSLSLPPAHYSKLYLNRDSAEALGLLDSGAQIAALEWRWIDGIRTNISRIRSANVLEVHGGGFVVGNGEGAWAHGKTISKAKADLLYKLSERSLDDFKDLDPDKKMSFADGVSLYRTATGACSEGCKIWVQQNGISSKKKYSVNEILKLTKGAYNNEALVSWAKGLKKKKAA